MSSLHRGKKLSIYGKLKALKRERAKPDYLKLTRKIIKKFFQ